MVLTENQKNIKIREIASKLGVQVDILLENKTKEQVIAEYNANTLGMLNE